MIESEQNDRCDAIVVRRVPYRDSDLILTLLTRELGKISALARGARRSKKRFGASLDTFARSRFQLSPSRRGELFTVSNATITQSHSAIAMDLAAVAHAGYVTEVTRELLAPEHPEPEIYQDLVELLESLEDEGPKVARLRFFECRLLDRIGLLPDLESCLLCGEAPTRPVIGSDRGGVYCMECASSRNEPILKEVPVGVLQYLTALRSTENLNEADQVDAHGNETEARDIMLDFVSYQVGKPLKSIEFLVKLSAGLQS